MVLRFNQRFASLEIKHVNNDWITERSPLNFIYTKQSFLVDGISTKSVHSFSRKGNQFSLLNHLCKKRDVLLLVRNHHCLHFVICDVFDQIVFVCFHETFQQFLSLFNANLGDFVSKLRRFRSNLHFFDCWIYKFIILMIYFFYNIHQNWNNTSIARTFYFISDLKKENKVQRKWIY